MWKALYKPECNENDFVNAENHAGKKKNLCQQGNKAANTE